MRRSDSEIALRREAAKLGVRVIEVGITGGGHKYALITRAGICRKVFYPSTPGDHRGSLNLACTVRRVVRAMGGQGSALG
jgi:hypothetical protein